MASRLGRRLTLALCLAIALCFFSTVGVNQAFASYRQQESPGYRHVPQNPGTLTIEGRWKYYDRNNQAVPAKRFFVELYSGTTWLQWTFTDDNGYFEFSVPNPGTPVKVVIYTYDNYVVYPGSYHEIMVVEPLGTSFLDAHTYTSRNFGPYSDGYHYIGTLKVPSSLDELDAWWVKDDLDKGYTYLPDKMGPFIAEWDWDCEFGFLFHSFFCYCTVPLIWPCNLGHIYMDYDEAAWQDIVLHEMGHAVMWHIYDGYWSFSDCFDYLLNCAGHKIETTSCQECAWFEGWADFWAIAVNDDPQFLIYNLENGTGGDPWDNGDEVEGRVSGALWDIYDDHDDGNDEYDGEFDDIWDVVYSQTDDTFAEFWDAWKDRGHNIPDVNAAIYQNTIDYNNPPSCTIISPNGGGWYWGTITVSASASDDSGGYVDGSISKVKFQYSRDNSNWYTIGTDTSPSGGWSVSWDTSIIEYDSTVWVRAKAKDNLGEWSSWDKSDSSFGIDNIPMEDLMEGDTNLSCCVSIVDAMFIAQHVVGYRAFTADQLLCGDTTDEGDVTLADAMHVAQWVCSVPFKPLWESPADDDMLPPAECGSKGGMAAGAGKGTVVSIPDAAAIHGSNVTVPISIDDVSNLGAIEIRLSYNSSVVEVAAVADGTLGSPTYGIFNDDGVTKMGWFAGTGETGNFTFANVTLRAVGSGGDASALDLTVREMVDPDANPLSCSVDDGTFTVTPIVAETSLGQELESPADPSSVILVPVNIDRAKDGVTGENISGIEIDSYNAEASYLYDPPDGMEMLEVDPGDAPFDDPVSEIHNNDPGDDWTVFSQDPAGSAEAPLSVARLVVRLIGSAYNTHNLTANFDSIMATIGEELTQESPAVATYQRGDACVDGEVTTTDATWVGEYLVGSRSLDELGALNAACPSHDGDNGDKIKISDAMFIAQFCSGARDEYYELIEGSKSGAFTSIASGEVTAELSSAKVSAGRTVLIPIIVKGIPVDSAGLGCYDLKLTFNPKVVRVGDIDCNGIDFARPAAVNIDNAKGVVLLNGFQSSIPGPVGDVTLAYLAVTVTGSPGDSGMLDVEITTLADSMGNDIVTKDADDVVAIGSGP